MSNWSTRLVILGLLAVIVGVPLALRQGGAANIQTAADGSNVLVVMTPHNEQIRHEFSTAFNAWRAEQGRTPVVFDWRASGGTSDLVKQVFAQLEAAARIGRENDGVGADLFFGGGDYYHNSLAKGIEIERDGRRVRISATIPIQIPDDVFNAAFSEPTINGAPLYHRDRHWVGVVLSSFGIVYNRDVLNMLELPEPRTWADLADPAYRRWVALTDPAHSGSIAAAYNAILMRLGWEEGWRLQRRIFANARYFTSSASKVPVDVSAGEAAAGMCIDFYGRFQAGAIASYDGSGAERVGYVDPPFMTAINADPISILRGTRQRELANEFCLWLLSIDAQRLWQRRIGSEGGPRRFELRRVPIRRDMYVEDEMAAWIDQVDPWAISRPFPEGMPMFFGVLPAVAHAMAIDIHDDLTAAWRAILDTGDEELRRRMFEQFDRMPDDLIVVWDVGSPPDESVAQLLADPSHPRHRDAVECLVRFVDRLEDRYDGPEGNDRLIEDRLRWTLFFRENYRAITAMAR